MDKNSKRQPQRGQRVLFCAHAGDEKRMFTFFHFKDAVTFPLPGGKLGLSHWMVICSECQVAYKHDLAKSIKSGVKWKSNEPLVEARVQ